MIQSAGDRRPPGHPHGEPVSQRDSERNEKEMQSGADYVPEGDDVVKIVYPNVGFYSCLRCITVMVVSGVRSAVAGCGH